MNWFNLSLLSIIALAVAELMQQHILHTRRDFDERTSGVLVIFIQSLFTLPIILLTDLRSQVFSIFQTPNWPYIFLVTLIVSIAMIYYLRSLMVKSISISNIFVSLSMVVSTALGIVLFNEGYYLTKFVGIALILFAIVSLNFKNIYIEKNNLYGLLAGMFFGVAYTLDKKIVLGVEPIIYIFWSFALTSFFGFIADPKTVTKAIAKARISSFKPIFYSGVGYFLYNFFTFNAYRIGGEVGRIDAINNSQVFIVLLVEYFVFKNTKGMSRKIFAAFVAFFGVFLLGFY